MKPQCSRTWHPDDVTEPRYRWQFPGPAAADRPRTLAAGARHGLDERVTRLLAARGVADEAAIDAFFAAPEAGLHDPELLPDAAAFRDRIARARRDGERVLVFGDFDADGLTGLAIVVLALRRLGVTAIPYVPSRLEEGHGLSHAAVAAAREAGATVIVTVDCGTTSLPEIAAARDAGIDVLVTDHHRVPAELPAAIGGRQPAAGRQPLPGAAARRQRRRVQDRPAAARGRARRRRPRPSSWPTSRRSAASPTSSRCSARRGRSSGSASTGSGAGRGRGSPRSWPRPGSRRAASTSRRSGSRSLPGSTPRAGWGRRSSPRACCSARPRGRSPGARRGAGDGQRQPA